MKSYAAHENQALHVNVKSFNILRAITDTNFFSKAELGPTARLVMFNLANMYNPKKGFVYPKNNKLTKCTGAGERAVSQAVGELKDKGFIVIVFDENFRKIYFTQKTYELLNLVADEKEEEDGKMGSGATQSPKNEQKFVENGFAAKSEKNAVGVAEKLGGVAKNALTCHEQKKEQIKKQFLNFEKDFNFDRERMEVKEAFKGGGFLTDKMRSEIILNGFHRHNVKGDSDFKAIFRIKKVWGFEKEKFDVLRFIEEKRKTDMIFARKIEKIEHDVEFSLIGYEREIEELRGFWSNYKG